VSTPDEYVTDVFTVLRDGIVSQPRSMQKRIGPSEIGHPCARRLAYKLTGVAPVNEGGVAWKPFVGTALHEQAATIIARHEVERFRQGGDVQPRWMVEERVTVGQIDGDDITGQADLFDIENGVVYDWKFVGLRRLEDYRANGPGQQYRIQAHLYGRGFARAGRTVEHVAVVFMTRDGEFKDRYVWHEPYDEQLAVDALERAELIKQTVDLIGPDAYADVPAVESYCGNCPFFRAGSTDLSVACPGARKGTTVIDPLADMFAGR
jgi:hypothetical protein